METRRGWRRKKGMSNKATEWSPIPWVENVTIQLVLHFGRSVGVHWTPDLRGNIEEGRGQSLDIFLTRLWAGFGCRWQFQCMLAINHCYRSNQVVLLCVKKTTVATIRANTTRFSTICDPWELIWAASIDFQGWVWRWELFSTESCSPLCQYQSGRNSANNLNVAWQQTTQHLCLSIQIFLD